MPDSRGTRPEHVWFGRSGVPVLSLAMLLVASLLLAGCKNTSRLAPIEQLDPPPDIRLHHHTVSRGDTLYSIAWRYGMDYRQLASINSISPPYTIYVGQKLHLGGSDNRYSSIASSTASPGTQVIAVPDSGTGVSEVSVVTEVTEDVPVAPVAPSSPPTAVTDVKQDVERDVEPARPGAGTGKLQWSWPSGGRVITRFSAADPLRKGIDLDGKLGEAVTASAGGNVVYAGSGLTGYGQLIIVKHNEQFLSAYAHNSKLLVAEGQDVKAGQKIAEIGSSGTDHNKLHFEIRREGKPVDPLQYLPAR